MKFFVFICVFFILAANVYAQTAENGAVEDMLIGDCIREDFQDTSFASWFNTEYADYKVDTAAADSLKGILGNVEIAVILGTWCSDSHREIPRLFKVLDYLEYPSDKLIMKCVDRKLKTLSSDIDIYRAEAVPTIIFYKEGEELGRIIEAPDESLEKDMIKYLIAKR